MTLRHNKGSGTSNNPYASVSNTHHPVQVTLVCGCLVNARVTPMNKSATYPCPNNQGHGYRVRWREWWDGDKHGVNDKL